MHSKTPCVGLMVIWFISSNDSLLSFSDIRAIASPRKSVPLILQRLFCPSLEPAKEFRASKSIVQYNHQSIRRKKELVDIINRNKEKIKHFLKKLSVQCCPRDLFGKCQRNWYQHRSYEQWVFAGGRGGWC